LNLISCIHSSIQRGRCQYRISHLIPPKYGIDKMSKWVYDTYSLTKGGQSRGQQGQK
jgi:hypothetical protein